MTFASVPLRRVVRFVRNGLVIDQSAGSGGLPITRIETISEGFVDPQRVGYADLTSPPPGDYLLQAGDILYSHINSYDRVGKVAQYRGTPPKLIHGMNLLNVRPDEDRISSRYLFYALSSESVAAATRPLVNKAVNQASISGSAVMSVTVPLPPLDVQRRIVDFLEDQVAFLDRAVGMRSDQLALAEDRIRAVTTEEVSGLGVRSSTEATGSEWFPRLPPNWDIVSLGRLCSGVSDGPHFSPDYVDREDGYLFLSARNVKIDRWSLDDAKYISADDYAEFSKRVKPMIGDVLYTKGGTTGVARVVDLEERFQVWVHVAVLKIRGNLAMPEFIACALNSAPCYAQSQLFTRGATNNDLGLTRMVRIRLPLPPMKDQAVIVDRVAAATQFSAEFRHRVALQMRLLDDRKKSLITAAVTGEFDVSTASSRAAEVALSGIGGGL